MVLTVSFALSLVIGLSCHHRLQDSSPCRFDISVEISGPHDSAVREKRRSSDDATWATASRSNVRDDRETPLMRGGTARDMHLICASDQRRRLRPIGTTGKSLGARKIVSIEIFSSTAIKTSPPFVAG